MKIVDITLTPVSYPAPHLLRWGHGTQDTMGGTIIQVITDEGLVGLGDANGPIAVQRAYVRDTLLPLLRGQNPLDVERLWDGMARNERARTVGSQLIGGVDIALWDLVGKAANLPLYRVFGAYRDRVPVYIAPSKRQPEVLMEELADYREQGFRAVKLRIGLGPVGWADQPRDQQRDVAILRRGREVLGESFTIGADTDRTYDHAMTARIAPVVHEVDLAWLEEPLRESALDREHYVEEMLRLRQIVHVPLSGGQGMYGVHAFDALINQRAVDLIQPDVGSSGGLTPARKVAAMAQGRGIGLMPHVACGCGYDLRVVATAHLLAAAPNGTWLCYPAYDTPLRTDLLVEQPLVREGELQLSEKPGLGIELNPEALERLTAAA
ncbi:MAG: mandelate racemase/muconate lactonizing enzyme family protein [Chloroflexota bacterium]|nr:mandelate racemase/muconate lactonizing enzyme family protein [Chloroflexota bacterium]